MDTSNDIQYSCTVDEMLDDLGYDKEIGSENWGCVEETNIVSSFDQQQIVDFNNNVMSNL